MSPMCWPIQAWRPEATQKVFLSSPPTASVGSTSTGSVTGNGA